MEAYDVDADAATMLDPEWSNVPLSYRASDWSKLSPANDFRASLSWRGRFAGIANAVNCYSPTEDVLANAEVGQLAFSGGAWKMQELFKGRGLGVGLGATDWSGWNIEENWFGVNKISVEQALILDSMKK